MSSSGLPPAAVALVSRIEALLAEADHTLAHTSVVDETSYALGETSKRYLPDTISGYLNLPPSQRDATAEEMLIGQLTLLERATAQRLSALAESLRISQAANGAFLATKFGTVESMPAAPELSPADVPPRTLVSRLFEQLETSSGNPTALVEVAAQRFSSILPNITTVKRGLFGGPAKAIVLEVPVGDHVLRYAISAERSGLETVCTKVVRGIALRTERVDVGDWLRALFEDVSNYVERDRTSSELLSNFFRR